MKTAVCILLIINLVTFCIYGIDKYRAKKNRWRISEKTLLLMGLCFGSVGQIAGMKFFHHKTHKWYFNITGPVFLILHILAIYMYIKFL